MGKLQDYYNKATGMADNNEDDHERSGAPADDIQFTKEKGIQEATQKSAEPATPPPSPQKPNWMTDDDFKEATQYFSPDQLNKLYKDFDPQSATPLFQDLYKASIKAPEVLDEKRIKASNTIAGVADALSLLTQGIAGANGAYIPKMDQSSLKQNSDYVQRMRDIYKADRDRYNAGLFESSSRDIEAARQGHVRDRNTLLGVIQNARKLKTSKEIAGAKSNADMHKIRLQQEAKGITETERIRHNKEMERIASKNAETNSVRASKGGSTSSQRGYTDWYNPNTGYSYKLKENNIKAVVPQIFKEFEKDIFKGNSTEKRKYEALSPSERYNYVQAHWMESPSAVAILEQIAEGKEGDGTPIVGDKAGGVPPIIDILLGNSRPEANIPYRREEAGEGRDSVKENNQKKSAWR